MNTTPSNTKQAFELARKGELPEGFTDWHLADKNGWTVAHVAAWHGHLPHGFTGLHMADNNGRTVAHVAAQRGHLPACFDELAQSEGAAPCP